MAETALPNPAEIAGKVEGKKGREYTREEVIKSYEESFTLFAASKGQNGLSREQLAAFGVAEYGHSHAFIDKFGQPKKKEYGKFDVEIHPREFGPYTQQEGPAVEGLIDFLGYLERKAPPEERERYIKLRQTLIDNSQGYYSIKDHIRRSPLEYKARIEHEAWIISQDPNRNTRNETDNYNLAKKTIEERRELVLPSATRNKTQTASTNGVAGTASPAPVRTDSTPEGSAGSVRSTATEYSPPAPVKEAMAREALGGKPPAPDTSVSGGSKATDTELPPSPVRKTADTKLTADEAAPFKPENLEEDDDLPPGVSSIKDILDEKAVIRIGNRQRDIEVRARMKATEAVNEQLRAGNWFRKILTRIREVYLTELYTQRLIKAMKESDNVNVDFDPVKNALGALGGDSQRDEAKAESMAALEHASSDETIDGEEVHKISKATNPELYDAFLTDILKPTYDGGIKDEKELQKKLAEFVKKNTASTVDPKIREPLLKVFGSDEKQLASVAEYFASDVIESVGKLRENNQALSEMDDLIEIELSNVRWGAETQANYKWHDKVMNWTKRNNIGGAFLNPLVAGAVASFGIAGVMAARGALRKGANLVAPVIGGAAVGALFSALRRNTELKTDRATYMAERAVGGEKKTTAENRNAFWNLMHADTMHDMGNFEYDMVDEKDLRYGGGAKLLDDDGKFVDDPSKRKERRAIADLISNNDIAGIIDRIGEIRARRNYSSKHGVDLIRVDASTRVQRDRNLQLDNTLKMLRQQLESQGNTPEQVKALTAEAEKKWIAAFDQDVNKQDEEFGKYKGKRIAVGAATSFATGLIGAGIIAGGREVLQETGAGQAIASGFRAVGDNLRNIPVAEIGRNAAFNALGPVEPAARAGLAAFDLARDQAGNAVRENLPGVEHGLQVMFDEAPALNAMGELGENALNAARGELADAGAHLDRFGNLIEGSTRSVIGDVKEDFDTLGHGFNAFKAALGIDDAADVVGDNAADAAGDVADQAAGQTEVLDQISREYVIHNPITEQLKDHYDHFTRDIIPIGDPGDNLAMHVANRSVGFYHADGTAFGTARGIIEADGSLKITGEMPSTLKAILKDEGFTIADGASRVETILQEIKGTVESPINGNMTLIPEGTEWRPQGDGTFDLVFSDKPDQVLINNAHFDGGGKMIWDQTNSILTDRDINFEEVPVTEPGRSTVNIVNRNGIWATDNVRNVDSVWYTNTEPDAVGNSDLNERSLWLRTDGNGVTLETHLTQDVSFIDANNNDLIDSTDAQINVRNAINENRVGFAFSLPGSENQTIIVQAVNGNLILSPDSGELVRIWDGSGFNKTMPSSELYNALVNQEAVARMPGGYVAGGQDVFKLGVNQDGVIRNGLVRIVVPENNNGSTVLNTIATIQSHGAADVNAEIIPGAPTEDLNLITRIDIPDQTNEIPTYDITPPPDRSVPVDPIRILRTPETPIPTPTAPKPEYTTYIPVVSTPGVTENRYNILADAVVPTNLTPRDALDPRNGKPGKEKKPGETAEELREKTPLESQVPGAEKAPKEKAADVMENRVNISEGVEVDTSRLQVGEHYREGRANQDRMVNMQLANGRFVGIYDGHGTNIGHRAAEFARDNLHNNFLLGLNNNNTTLEALSKAFLKTDAGIEANERQGYEYGGATALAAYIEGDKIYVANAGDAQAFLLKADGSVVELTHKHNASDPAERERIIREGGEVDENGYIFPQNNPEHKIMVARSLGDSSFDMVSPEPSVKQETITPDTEWGILASDGLWDVMNPQDVLSQIKRISQEHPDYSTEQISKLIADRARQLWDDFKKNDPNTPDADDISLQLLDFRGYVKKK